MFWPSYTYKDIIKNSAKSFEEIQDRMDCLQRSHVYIHNHITKVENDIAEVKKLILYRLTHSESYDIQMAEMN
jgi:hypothetical protein